MSDDLEALRAEQLQDRVAQIIHTTVCPSEEAFSVAKCRIAADAVLTALAPYVTAQVEQRDAEYREVARLSHVYRNERDRALARVDTARRDALAPVLALCDKFEHMGWGSASDYDKGGQRCAERIRAAVESPDQPEADGMCPNCVTPWKCNGPHVTAQAGPGPLIAPPETDNEDAMAWAESFVSHVQHYPQIATDAGTMVGWFANAMMTAEHRVQDAYDRGQQDASALLGVTAQVEQARQDEAGAWVDSMLPVQEERDRLREQRDAMLTLHSGYAEGSQPLTCCGGCGPWPCPTYLAAYPEVAWRADE